MNYYAESMADEIKMSLGGGVLAGLGDERVAYVSRDDVAAAAAGALLGEGHAGAIYNLTGPASITGPERAAIVSEIVGKPISYAPITVNQLRVALAQAGLPQVILDAMTEIKTTFIKGKFDIVTGISSVFPVVPRGHCATSWLHNWFDRGQLHGSEMRLLHQHGFAPFGPPRIRDDVPDNGRATPSRWLRSFGRAIVTSHRHTKGA